jgi:hypothetical protein
MHCIVFLPFLPGKFNTLAPANPYLYLLPNTHSFFLSFLSFSQETYAAVTRCIAAAGAALSALQRCQLVSAHVEVVAKLRAAALREAKHHDLLNGTRLESPAEIVISHSDDGHVFDELRAK